MNIDMFWIWLAIVSSTLIFQNYFTEKKTTWDVSYTYTTEAMDYIVYGQQSLTSWGTDLPWRAARRYLAKDIMKTNNDKEPVIVVILAINKDTCDRFVRPFWKRINWYS